MPFKSCKAQAEVKDFSWDAQDNKSIKTKTRWISMNLKTFALCLKYHKSESKHWECSAAVAFYFGKDFLFHLSKLFMVLQQFTCWKNHFFFLSIHIELGLRRKDSARKLRSVSISSALDAFFFFFFLPNKSSKLVRVEARFELSFDGLLDFTALESAGALQKSNVCHSS